MKILITGCCGFIGSHLYRELSKEHEVIGADDLSGGSLRNIHDIKMPFRRVDLREYDRTKLLFDEYRPDVVYHLAANAREGASFFQPASVISRNSGAYANVLSNAVRVGVKRIIMFSSIAVYGEQQPPFHEALLPEPVDIYGLEKAKMEYMTQMMCRCHGIENVILRPYNVFGPNQAINDIFRNVFGIWMNQIMRGEPMTIYGDGRQQRSFTFIGDVIDAFVKVATYKPEDRLMTRNIFNIGSKAIFTILEAADLVRHHMDSSAHPIRFLPGRYNEVEVAYCTTDRMEKVLGIQSATREQTKQGIYIMAEWAKKVGPMPWYSTDKLEIVTEKTPEHWRFNK